jgi:proline iminopeptidase
MNRSLLLMMLVSILCLGAAGAFGQTVPARYLDYSGLPDQLSGGSRMIPIQTPQGTFKVWVKRIGNNPTEKVLILHGGPGMTHEYLEAVDSYLPGAGIEYYHYDQLGSFLSDQPDDLDLWRIPRFVEEVEQVRVALGLDKDNFYLYGHSWGGILALEYALKYQQHLKGLIISDMMSSIPAYNGYSRKVLQPEMDPAVLAEILAMEKDHRTDDPRYMELLTEHYYTKHILRMPPEEWPDGVLRAFAHMNETIYVTMQGPSEMGASGRLEHWDRSGDLGKITVPTLTIGARYDTMDPKHIEWMSRQVQHGRYLYCVSGSHLCMYDDQKTYFDGLIKFIKDVDAGKY